MLILFYSRFENDDNLELRRRYDEYRKSQGQFTIEDVRDFFDNGHSHNRGNTHIVDHLLEEQYENEVWVLDTLEEYSKEYNKKTVKGTFAARLCHLWDDDFSEEDIYERLEKYGFNLENTTFYPLMKEQLFILNNHLRINSHKLINTVFSPYQEFEHIKFDNAQDNAENYSRYSDDLADEIARDEEWNCDICNGNNETGCLYFDPTECPKLT